MPELNVPIDWASVNWVYVILLAAFVFVAALVGNLLSFNRRGWGALLSAVLFAAMFVFWSYYPHHLSFLPTRLGSETAQEHEPAGMPAAPPAATTPQKPANPVTDITPPKNPVTTVTPPKQ